MSVNIFIDQCELWDVGLAKLKAKLKRCESKQSKMY